MSANDLILILCNSFFFHQFLNHRRLEASDLWALFKKVITLKIRLCVDDMSQFNKNRMSSWKAFVLSCDNILLCSSRLETNVFSVSFFSFFSRFIELYRMISIKSCMRTAQAMISMKFSFRNCFAFSMRFARVKRKTTSSAIKMIEVIRVIMMFIFE